MSNRDQFRIVTDRSLDKVGTIFLRTALRKKRHPTSWDTSKKTEICWVEKRLYRGWQE